MGERQISAACPHCGKRYTYSTDNPFRPFCSERCKMIDLGQWFDGSHHIAGPELDDESVGPVTDADDPANDS